MQVVCVRAFGLSKPGDLSEVPDGALTDPDHWAEATEADIAAAAAKAEQTPAEPSEPAAPPAFPPAAALTPKES